MLVFSTRFLTGLQEHHFPKSLLRYDWYPCVGLVAVGFATVINNQCLCLQVTEPLALALDWTIEAHTMRLRPLVPEHPGNYRAEEATAPTTLENLLQAYVEEEQLTGANQWRCVDVFDSLCCSASG